MLRNLVILAVIFIALLASVFWFYDKWSARQARLESYKQAEEQKFEEVSVTLIEGWTNDEFYAALEKKGLATKQYYIDSEAELDRSKYDLLESVPEKATLIGFLFPDTYRFPKVGGESQVLPTLVSTFVKKFDTASQGVSKEGQKFVLKGFENLSLSGETRGLTPFELITLASIVEKETGQAGEPANSDRLQEERQVVAGIFLNRLAIGQALESDATVNFVTGAGRAQATYQDLATQSPYNTYQNAGLPPGPIANISFSSLYAVLHPKKTDYYYFLHKQPSGEVVYSKTFNEHIQNKNRYLK